MNYTKKIVIFVFSVTICLIINPTKTIASEYLQYVDFNSNSYGLEGYNNVSVDTKNGVNSSKCIKISNSSYASNYFIYEFSNLNNNKTYVVEVDIKTDNVVSQNSNNTNAGALIFNNNGGEPSKKVIKGTSNYQTVSLMATPVNNSIAIVGVLGYYDQLAKGTAYFDNLRIKEMSYIEYLGGTNITSDKGNITLVIDNSIINDNVISYDRLENWVNNLQKAFETFQQLTGFKPYENIIINAKEKCEYIAYVTDDCNVIHVDKDFMYNDLSKMNYRIDNNLPDWNFCVLHEMGHMFDSKRAWNFEAEMMTDLKLVYVLEKNNAGAVPSEFNKTDFFFGSNMEECYYRICNECNYGLLGDYSYSSDAPKYSFYGAALKFVQIKNIIGWEPFEKTFKYLQTAYGSNIPKTNNERFILFLNKLSEYGGIDVSSLFTREEWLACIDYYGDYNGIPVKNITLSDFRVTLLEGEQLQLNTKIEPSNATYKRLLWQSDDTRVATVDSAGKVLSKNPGVCTIECIAEDTKTVVGVCYVEVLKPEENLPYPDVTENDWSYPGIKYAYQNEIMTGHGDGTFKPTANLTRAEIATILYRMEGSPKVTVKNIFPDVQSNAWSAPAIQWAYESGIVTGYLDSGTFGPSNDILRQDLALMLKRYAEYKEKYNSSSLKNIDDYQDYTEVSDYAIDGMKWAVGNGIIRGNNGETTLDPQKNATRAEVATIIMRYCKNILEWLSFIPM